MSLWTSAYRITRLKEAHILVSSIQFNLLPRPSDKPSNSSIDRLNHFSWNSHFFSLGENFFPIFLSVFTVRLNRVVSKSSSVVFLNKSSHLYKRVCPSVGPSVRPSVFFSNSENDEQSWKNVDLSHLQRYVTQQSPQAPFWVCLNPCIRPSISCISFNNAIEMARLKCGCWTIDIAMSGTNSRMSSRGHKRHG